MYYKLFVEQDKEVEIGYLACGESQASDCYTTVLRYQPVVAFAFIYAEEHVLERYYRTASLKYKDRLCQLKLIL